MSALLRQNEHVDKLKKTTNTWVHSEFEFLNKRT